MLYIFSVLGTEWLKFGYTGQPNPWLRIRNGFWTNCHPSQLCNRLGPESLELLHVFEGDRRVEAVMQSLFPPTEYEFWDRSWLEAMVEMLRLMAEEIPVPPRPQLLCISNERLPCCSGGQEHICDICGKTFRREHLMREHKNDVHLKRKWRCACGVKVTRRNLGRHMQSKRHRRTEDGTVL